MKAEQTNFIINNVQIIDPLSPNHQQKKSILIVDGIIKEISDRPFQGETVLEGDNLYVSPGWIDMRVTIGDPGLEHKEDIFSACKAAAFGGFTELLCMPNTRPSLHSKEIISYIKNKAQNELVEIHVAASVTQDRHGKDLTEMIDLHHAGALAFTDGEKPIWHTDIFLKSLQYLQSFDGLLIDHAEEPHLSHSGQMNEGYQSTLLGLKGIPKLSEEIVVQRNLEILKYTGGRLHLSHISSPNSLQKIKDAKREGLSVSCDIASYQLVLDDSFVSSFDTNYKVNPPLRDKEDIEMFWQALKEGVIDAVVSDHIPQDEECKNLEFDLADFGILGLETVFPLLSTYGKNYLSINQIIEKLSINPRKILKIPVPLIQEGEIANLTIFNPDLNWTYELKDINSKSKNTPFIGTTFTGKAIAVYNKGKFIIN